MEKHHADMLGSIKTKEEFLDFMHKYMAAEEDASLKYYLEAVAAWTDGMENYYNNTGKKVPENINWDFIATLFYVGSIYE